MNYNLLNKLDDLRNDLLNNLNFLQEEIQTIYTKMYLDEVITEQEQEEYNKAKADLDKANELLNRIDHITVTDASDKELTDLINEVKEFLNKNKFIKFRTKLNLKKKAAEEEETRQKIKLPSKFLLVILSILLAYGSWLYYSLVINNRNNTYDDYDFGDDPVKKLNETSEIYEYNISLEEAIALINSDNFANKDIDLSEIDFDYFNSNHDEMALK